MTDLLTVLGGQFDMEVSKDTDDPLGFFPSHTEPSMTDLVLDPHSGVFHQVCIVFLNSEWLWFLKNLYIVDLVRYNGYTRRMK